MERTKEFYNRNFVDDQFYDRIRIIYNSVDIPPVIADKGFVPPLKVLYVGRDTPEKAVGRVFELAKRCNDQQLPVKFTLVGDIKKRVHPGNLVCKGEIRNKKELSDLYNEHHFVIITSVSEGFPLSISEGMAHGCIPVATAVGDIPFHINSERGFTVSSSSETPEAMLLILKSVCRGNVDLPLMSHACRSYVEEHFNQVDFKKQYRELFMLDPIQRDA